MDSLNNPYAAAIAMERAKISEYEKRIAACRGRIAALEGLADAEPDDVDAALERKLKGLDSGDWYTVESEEVRTRVAAPPSLATYSPPIYPGTPPLPKLPTAETDPSVQSGSTASTLVPPPPLPPPGPFVGRAALPSFFFAPPPGPTMLNPLKGESVHRSESGDFVLPKRQVSAQAIELLRFLRAPATSDTTFAFTERRGIKMNRASLSTFLYAYRTKYGFLDLQADGRYVLSERGRNYIDAPARRDIKFEPSDAGATASEEE
ncbi:hypothetical protein [Microbacterium sp. NPDC057467]|jgi:hypothetical protein